MMIEFEHDGVTYDAYFTAIRGEVENIGERIDVYDPDTDMWRTLDWKTEHTDPVLEAAKNAAVAYVENARQARD